LAQIIDGKALAQRIRSELAASVATLKANFNLVPKLAVVLLGEDPASQVYVRNKERACAEVGILSDVRRIPSSIKQKELLDIIRLLNNDQTVHGILVQLPLPQTLDAAQVLDEVSPLKDVDGLHSLNMGKLLKGEEPFFIPCTPRGVVELILSTGVDIAGKEAVVVGRSNIVGKPLSLLLLQRHATVTICHSRTRELGQVTGRADILVVAAGRKGMVQGEMIKKGALVVDVGINRVGGVLVGDVDHASAEERAAFLTPVPGGVGPMTIAMLLRNTVKAAELVRKPY
jgi:methylenetetrahydrofolate dehydrogenase (NADP+)/methenyltetrahydrofolate cyclohydrolase